MKLRDFIDKIFKREVEPTGQRNIFNAIANNQLNSDWNVQFSTKGDANFKYNIPLLREKARDLSLNNSYIVAFMNLLKNNVIGKNGITLSANVTNDNGTPDLLANKIIENAFYSWGKNPTINSNINFVELQKMLLITMLRDGEVFVLKIKDRTINKFGFALQVFEPDWVDYELNQDASSYYIRHGIEYNYFHKPIAVHINKYPANWAAKEDLQASDGTTRVPIEDIIHLFMPERISQGRGYSALTSVMYSVRMMDAVNEAGVTNIRIGASKMGFFVNKSDQIPDGFTGMQSDTNGNLISGVSPGDFQRLPNGVEFQSFNPDFPQNALQPFIQHILRSISTALGISYNTLTMDLENVSYSSIRAGVDMERDTYRNLQEFMIDKFMAPIFEEWLMTALAMNALAPLPASKLWKFSNATFQARAFSYVNPVDDVTSDVLAMENNIFTLNDVLSKQGKNLIDHLEQLKAEQDLLKKYGLQKQDIVK
jgi:lambda family phage portal protein